MKTLIIQICNNPRDGGAELIAERLFEKIKGKNIDNFAIFFENIHNYPIKNNQIVIGNCCWKNFINNSFKLNFYIYKISKRYPKVIINAHSTQALYSLIPLKLFRKFKLTYTEHNSYNNRRKYKFLKTLEKFIYSFYIKIFAITPFVKQELLSWLDITKENNKVKDKFIVIFNGCPQYKFIKRPLNKKKYRLISIGNLTRQKGYDLAIDAISKCQEYVDEYLILGHGTEKEYLEKFAKERNIEHIVKFEGYQKNIKKYLEISDIGLIPSRWEGFGIVSIEMISSGLPLCISNVGGMKDILKQFKSVDIVEKNCEKYWSEAITNMIINLPSMTKVLKESSVKANLFSIDEMIKKYKYEYLDL